MSSWPQTPAQCTIPRAPARAWLGSGQLSPGEGGELCLLPDPCGACRPGHLSSRQPVPALTLVGSLQRHRQMGSKDPRASRLCRRGPALHNPGRALPPLSLSSLRGVFAGGSGSQTEDPHGRPRGEGACRAGASDHLPSTDRKQAHGARGDLQGQGPACSKAGPRGKCGGLSAV